MNHYASIDQITPIVTSPLATSHEISSPKSTIKTKKSIFIRKTVTRGQAEYN